MWDNALAKTAQLRQLLRGREVIRAQGLILSAVGSWLARVRDHYYRPSLPSLTLPMVR